MIQLTDPNVLAAKLMVEFAGWLVRSTTTASSWKWTTSYGAGGSVSTPFKLVGASGVAGAVELHRGDSGHEEHVKLAYTMGGVGIGIAPPTQVVTITGSLPSFPSDGRLRLFKGQHDFARREDFMVPGQGLFGPCMALTVEGTAALCGWTGGIMLLGIDDELVSIFHTMQRHTQELIATARRKAPDGAWNRVKDSVTRPLTMMREEALIGLDQARLLMRLQTGPRFKAALFFHGAEFAASELLVTLSASITGYAGIVHAMA